MINALIVEGDIVLTPPAEPLLQITKQSSRYAFGSRGLGAFIFPSHFSIITSPE